MITRLNKYLSECGIASRRKSDELIQEGRVQVNGSTVFELGTKINPDKDEVYVDGEKLKEQKKVYFLLNKPIGVITSTSDEKNRVTVVDLIKTKEKIFPVGRLDYNTSGVIMLTNDGEFSNYLTHPKNGIEREYTVKIDKPLELEDKEKLLKGIYLDNRKSKFTSVTFPKKNIFKLVNVTTVEGRNHFVKRMFDALGYGVNELSRIRYGKINVKNMKPGEYRIITEKEVKMLMK
ncbi:MAG: rRNA pseudouridine synthase [Ignavibacteriales bacterium]|nr:rRNA pseudouridine synthase [Ignavibacteriales bacterium]